MQALFRDIMALQGVRGVMLLSLTGEILYEQFHPSVDAPLLSRDGQQLLEMLSAVRESDLVFTSGRLYVRRTLRGFVMVVTSLFAQSAMIRLHCDILLPELARVTSRKKRRFFKR